MVSKNVDYGEVLTVKGFYALKCIGTHLHHQ